MAKYRFDDVPAALEEIRKGRLVIVLDSKEREYEGDFIGAAAQVTPKTVNFLVTHARGAYVAVFMPAGRCDALGIPPVGVPNTSFNATKFRVSVDARSNVSGSSAFDRAETVRLLGDPKARPADFVKPGHIVPIEAHPQGFQARRGHTEAGVELMRLAGIDPPVAVDLEILDDDGRMAREEKLFQLAREFKIRVIRMQDLVAYAAGARVEAGAR
jgi:3,4-dihydroxy 2-butanone 4-phosphate synthase/GTP cyclohydrolase II